jgi:hypothetical protein
MTSTTSTSTGLFKYQSGGDLHAELLSAKLDDRRQRGAPVRIRARTNSWLHPQPRDNADILAAAIFV